MPSLTVTLRQHTPIIHFQSAQPGATLRATELKPKLDKFLLATGLITDESTWRLYKPHNTALDYQVRVAPVKAVSHDPIKYDANREPERDGKGAIKTNEYKGFFGNMGKKEVSEIKKYVTSDKNQVQVHFFALDASLLNVIKTQLPTFLSWYNFGTRQTKGFGCFYIDESDPLYKGNEKPTLRYCFTLHGIKQTNIGSVFEQLDFFYRSLRAGINLKDRQGNDLLYFKSLLFKYAKDGARNQWGTPFQWEKKSIKETYYNGNVIAIARRRPGLKLSTQQTVRPTSEPLTFSETDKKLVKDLFGLSSEESWMGYGTVTKEHKSADNAQHIDRFASPIIFKPIWDGEVWHIYFGAKPNAYKFSSFEDTDMAYLGQSFSVLATGGEKVDPPLSLSMPETFDIDQYLRYVFDRNKFSIASHVEPKFHGHDAYKWLKHIYDQLQSRSYA